MTTRPRTPAPGTPAPGKLALTELAELKARPADRDGDRLRRSLGPARRCRGRRPLLVGDSAAMTVLGHDSTVPATMDEMLVLTRAVTRGAQRPLVVADMPFGSFQVSDEEALRNAVRFVKEAGADAVKLEGAGPTLSRVQAIVGAGIPVMGHIGLTPQSATMLGGFKAQGRRREGRRTARGRARARGGGRSRSCSRRAGPSRRGSRRCSRSPRSGSAPASAATARCSSGTTPRALRGPRPRFVKRYADSPLRSRAVIAYAEDVRAAFPEDEHTYAMPDEELESFLRATRDHNQEREQRAGQYGG